MKIYLRRNCQELFGPEQMNNLFPSARAGPSWLRDPGGWRLLPQPRKDGVGSGVGGWVGGVPSGRITPYLNSRKGDDDGLSADMQNVLEWDFETRPRFVLFILWLQLVSKRSLCVLQSASGTAFVSFIVLWNACIYAIAV